MLVLHGEFRISVYEERRGGEGKMISFVGIGYWILGRLMMNE